jgi:Putative collagen-binding domain of a collagenase
MDGRGSFAANDFAVMALADDGSFALSYLPSKRTLTIDLAKVAGERIVASRFIRRSGETTRIGEFTDKQRHAFEPPADGDWAWCWKEVSMIRCGLAGLLSRPAKLFWTISTVCFTCTLLAHLRKCLIKNGAGEGNRTLVIITRASSCANPSDYFWEPGEMPRVGATLCHDRQLSTTVKLWKPRWSSEIGSGIRGLVERRSYGGARQSEGAEG